MDNNTLRQRKTPKTKNSSTTDKELGKSDDNNWIGKIFVFLQWLMQAIVAVCLVGFLLNKGIVLYEKYNMKPLGSLVELTPKYKVNLWCNGPTNRETLFYISSSGGTFYQSYPLLIELSRHFRVCAYDRYGRGFSDDLTDVNIALAELENVTKVSKEKGPFVFIGHFYGGLLAANYALKHPEQVKALILLDTVTPNINSSEVLRDSLRPAIHIGEILSITGFMRIFTYFKPKEFGIEFYPDVAEQLKHFLNQQRAYSVGRQELDELFPQQVELLKNKTSSEKFQKLAAPVQLIFSQQFMEKASPAEVNKAFDNIKASEKLVNSLSDKTKQLELPSSNHFFPFLMPTETAREIKSFLDSNK